MKTYRVKAFLFVNAENEKTAEEIAAEALLSVSKDTKKVRVREGSAKLIEEKQNANKNNTCRLA